MGIHAFSDDAYLLTLDDLCRAATPEHIHGIKTVFDIVWHAYPADDAVHALRQGLRFVDTADALRDVLASYVSRVQEGCDYELQEHEPLQDVFRCICYVILPIQPEYVTVLNEHEVDMGFAPLHTPLLRFSTSQCFSLQMTTAGRQLAQSLGRKAIEPMRWTRIG